MNISKTLFALIIAMTFFMGAGLGRMKEQRIIEKKHFIDYNIPYQVKILNDHEVQCTTLKDTVLLFWENAYALGDEEIVFIQK